MESSVTVRREPLVLPTYLPMPPDRNPMFLEKRVYQGSSGKVYPLPFTDRIAEEKSDRAWDAVFLENAYLQVVILPEIGGRIHIGRDKLNGYDFFYNQRVIKPALVGLAGPWISGGVEFNWPQHHRPSTFMPADVEIESHADGAVTVWLSEHEPMNRMKGMHGVCLHPDKAYIEVKCRVHNRTPFVQTFLWWANVATHVHEQYQSFFPPDVRQVADHARRATSEFPLCRGRYYGIDYAGRAAHGVPEEEKPAHFVPNGDCKPNDLSWYANIPAPTSYMCIGSEEDFFGGYDHRAKAGVVHVANHHISPGKKQWTWGNHEFGYAWDRNLTDADGPYIELMAGVYTDNQPDFSFLQPGETRAWSQFWYPIREMGPAHQANTECAVRLEREGGDVRFGVCSTGVYSGAEILLGSGKRTLKRIRADLAPESAVLKKLKLRNPGPLWLAVVWNGRELIRYEPKPLLSGGGLETATEPPMPDHVQTNEELYLIGLHLEQYRHATRQPEAYWQEALRRDPGDARCNNAMGLWRLRRGEWCEAERCFRQAIQRLTLKNANPYDGEPYYNLGLALRYLGKPQEAYAAFYKATWNYAWQAASFHALAELDCLNGAWAAGEEHLRKSLRTNVENSRARNLLALVLSRLGRTEESARVVEETLTTDPLDWWARALRGEELSCDNQVRLDLALDYARAGFYQEAIRLLQAAKPEAGSGTAPLVEYYLAWLYDAAGDQKSCSWHLKNAASQKPDYCFPARLEEIFILELAMAKNPRDGRAPYYLGNLLYDRRRHGDAIRMWEKAAAVAPGFSIPWRNLGIGYFNIEHAPGKSRKAYDKAFACNRADARLLYERDQLWKRTGVSPADRLAELERFPELVRSRDDLTIERCALCNQTGAHAKALEILSARRFQPWEGGEGLALGQWVRAQISLGRAALQRSASEEAVRAFEEALHPPESLGEARHLLANQSDLYFWLGEAFRQAGDKNEAVRHWRHAAEFKGDFQEMSVRSFSEMTYFSALAWRRLGKTKRAEKLMQDLIAYARDLRKSEARIDYFATSLPAMLLFDEDLQSRQTTTAMFLEAQGWLGLGDRTKARRLLKEVLRRDPNHARAVDLLADRG